MAKAKAKEPSKDCPVCGGAQAAHTWDESKECSRLHLMGRAAGALERIAAALELANMPRVECVSCATGGEHVPVPGDCDSDETYIPEGACADLYKK